MCWAFSPAGVFKKDKYSVDSVYRIYRLVIFVLASIGNLDLSDPGDFSYF